MTRRLKVVLSVCATLAAAAGVGAGLFWRSHPLLKEVAQDLKAGAMSRHAPKPFERFLELRYGPMTEPVNRQKAFVGFFDTQHIDGMRRLVRYMKPGERQTNIAATAEWIASYRQSMSAAERQALADWLRSEEGRAQLQQASALFRSHDIAYRSATEPVIRELMTTLAMLHANEAEQ